MNASGPSFDIFRRLFANFRTPGTTIPGFCSPFLLIRPFTPGTRCRNRARRQDPKVFRSRARTRVRFAGRKPTSVVRESALRRFPAAPNRFWQGCGGPAGGTVALPASPCSYDFDESKGACRTRSGRRLRPQSRLRAYSCSPRKFFRPTTSAYDKRQTDDPTAWRYLFGGLEMRIFVGCSGIRAPGCTRGGCEVSGFAFPSVTRRIPKNLRPSRFRLLPIRAVGCSDILPRRKIVPHRAAEFRCDSVFRRTRFFEHTSRTID